MHPEMVRAIAARQIEDWLAAADNDRRGRSAGQGRKPRWRLGRRQPAGCKDMLNA
jgi:hypothetical protein